ncbi:MAG: hypothetical protein V4719_10080 [Planctomycetota bacterium]
MKAKLIRDLQGPNPKYDPEIARRAHELGRRYKQPRSIDVKAWAEIDDPEAWKLVKIGVAIPADAACRIKCGMTEAQMTEAQERYERLDSGADLEEHFDEIEANSDDDVEEAPAA